MANYQQLKAAIDQVIKANGQKEITGPILNDTLKAIVNSLGAGYQFAGVATPSTNPGTPDQNVFYIAGQAGTYTNFNGIVLPDGVSVLMWNGSWSSQTVLIGDGGVFDLSAYNAVGGVLATYADLSAALTALNALPAAYKRGGMSFKFVQRSDNKYVQYRLMKNQWSTTITDWQGNVNVSQNASSKGVDLLLGDTKVIPNINASYYTEEKEWNIPTTARPSWTNAFVNCFNNGKQFEIKVDTDITGRVDVYNGNWGVIQSNLPKGEWVVLTYPANATVNAIHIGLPDTALSTSETLTATVKSLLAEETKLKVDELDGTLNDQVEKSMYQTEFTLSSASDTTKKVFTEHQFHSGDLFYLRIDADYTKVSQVRLFDFAFAHELEPAEYNQYGKWQLCKATADTKGFTLYTASSYVSADTIIKVSICQNVGLVNIIDRIAAFTAMNITAGTDRYKTLFENRLFRANEPVAIRIKITGATKEILLYTSSWQRLTKDYTNWGRWLIITPQVDTQGIIFYALGSETTQNGQALIEVLDGELIDLIKQESEVKVNTITVSRDGTSGVDADFCGLNAIGDAIMSIKDASPKNIYNIYVRGHFKFTNPKMTTDGGDFKYTEGNEPSPVFTRKYINIIGIDADKAVIEVNLPDGLEQSDFPYSDSLGRYLTYSDYQPIYIRQGVTIKNITFIGRNCRYVSHIEVGGNDDGCLIEIDKCKFIEKSGSLHISCMTIGEIPQFTLNISNSTFVNEDGGTMFGGHTPLSNITNGKDNCKINFINCDFVGIGQISLAVYTYNRRDIIAFDGCKFSDYVSMQSNSDNTSYTKRNLGTIVDYKSTGNPRMFSVGSGGACGLRVKTISGSGTSVRFKETSSAFGVVGTGHNNLVVPLLSGESEINGYVFRDDANGDAAYACGTINIDPTTGVSLGSILGDCSQNSKTLTITINGTDYDVVFNTNLTSETNANILALINTVISSVAVCDTFMLEHNYYPQFDGVEYGLINGGGSSLISGMGVVKTAYNTIRAAKKTDGYIDGIIIDTIAVGQKGRIATKGVFYNAQSSGNFKYYSIYPYISNLTYGDALSIDENNDGYFVKGGDAQVLKALGATIVKFIKK